MAGAILLMISSGGGAESPGSTVRLYCPFSSHSLAHPSASISTSAWSLRGIGKEENIPLAQNIADKLNAQIGSSRPVVDAGWLDHSRQIGSSGQTVSPKLYFAVGISGAIQHLVGMKGSKCIMAINKDPNAPIFEIADYAIVGDLLEILPKLTENI